MIGCAPDSGLMNLYTSAEEISDRSKVPLPLTGANSLQHSLGTVAESVEPGPCVRVVQILIPSRVKPVNYIIDTCHFLATFSAIAQLCSVSGQCDWVGCDLRYC